MDLVELNSNEWGYRCEGARNVILFYTGSKKQFYGSVIRLNKDLSDSENDDQLKVHNYVKNCMSKLLGNQFAKHGKIIKVDKPFITKLNDKILPFRPKSRLRNSLHTDCEYVLMLQDFSKILDSHEPVFCVEIKPKWGVVCRSKLISEKHKLAKYFVCRYCMYQYLKYKQKKISKISQFCPLDLFSMDLKRMSHAIECLIENPQNNMRIYMNGNPVWSANNANNPKKLLEEFLSKYNLEISHFISIVTNCLAQSGVLQTIQRVQLLDKFDIEVIYKIYTDYIKVVV